MFKTVTITSKQKATGSVSNANFVVELKEQLYSQSVNAIQLISVSCPNVFYNVRQSNNKFKFQALPAGVPTIITIPEGFYTTASLITQLTAQMLPFLAGNILTVMQIPNDYRIKFSTDLGALTIFDDIPNLINSSLGISSQQTSTGVAPNFSLTCNSLPDLSGIDQIYIHSTTLGYQKAIGVSGLTNTVCSLSFANTPFGNSATRLFESADASIIRFNAPKSIGTIDIRVRSVSGEILDLGANHITLEFRAFYQNRF